MKRIIWRLSAAMLLMSCSSPSEVVNDVGSEPDVVSDVRPDISDDSADSDADTGDDATPVYLSIPEGCNPLAFEHDCLFPFPSNFFLVEDSTLPSGRRVQVPEAAQPATSAGIKVDLLHAHRVDGFSHHQPIVVKFPDTIDTEPLVFHDDDPAVTRTAASSTILLEVDGDAVVHWTELDRMTMNDGERVFFIRPYERLKNNTRYIVALQNLDNTAGELIAAPEGFRHIRDGVRGGHPVLDAELDRFEEDIFPQLEAFGVERGSLQLAWDFTTQTMEHVTADMLAMREHLLAHFESEAPAVTIVGVDEGYDELVFRRIRGTITVPLYLTGRQVDAVINRDDEGRVAVNGTIDVPFSIVIPMSVAERQAEDLPVRMIQYGHGFFGGRAEIDYSFMRHFSQDVGIVAMAVDWMGMAAVDRAQLAATLVTEPRDTMRFVDRTHQGIMNQLALTEAARTTFLELEELHFDGAFVYEPEEIYYYGISQGQILGGTLFPLSPHLDRAVLGVGGASFSFMMSRSGAFGPFLALLLHSFDDVVETQKFIALTPLIFDRVDPLTYAPLVFTDPIEGSPQRRLLMHVGIGDWQVPNLASHLHARGLNIPHLQPAPRPIVEMATIEGPVDGSAMMELDYGIDPVPDIYAAVPGPDEDNPVHEAVRRNPKIVEQVDLFFRPGGLIVHTCDGPCDPE